MNVAPNVDRSAGPRAGTRRRGAFATAAAVARAEVRERLRRRSFLLVAALVLWACFAAVPPPESNFSLLALGQARGVYNSAWFGLMFGLVTVFLAPLPGFYLVRGAVTRDRRSGVGRVLAATPASRWVYLGGKALANLAVLAALLVVISVAAAGMLLLRREAPGFDPVQLLAPIWTMGLPVLAAVAAAAVAFDCLPGLRGGFGNVLWFFVWTVGLGLTIEASVGADGRTRPGNDFFGMTRPIAEAQRRVAEVDPDYAGAFRLSIGHTPDEPLTAIPWPPMEWPARRLAERAVWFAPVLVLLLTAGAAFDRFDPARGSSRSRQRGSRRRRRGGRRRRGEAEAELATAEVAAVGRAEAAAFDAVPALTAPAPTTPGGMARTLLPLVAAELRLLLRGRAWWWWAVLGGLALAVAATDPTTAREDVMPWLWLWPVLVFSSLGAREHRHATTPLLAPAPGAWWRLPLAGWLAGVLVGLALAAPLTLRSLAAGDLGVVAAQLAAAAFVPALALACGSLTRGSRTFEALYVTLWYLAANGFTALDFFGRAQVAPAGWRPAVWLALALLLTAATAGWRRLAR